MPPVFRSGFPERVILSHWNVRYLQTSAAPGDIDHLLCHCPRFASGRRTVSDALRRWDDGPLSLQMLLEQRPHRTLAHKAIKALSRFFRATGLYESLQLLYSATTTYASAQLLTIFFFPFPPLSSSYSFFPFPQPRVAYWACVWLTSLLSLLFSSFLRCFRSSFLPEIPFLTVTRR